jgi:hypothetical protein
MVMGITIIMAMGITTITMIKGGCRKLGLLAGASAFTCGRSSGAMQ